MNVCWSKASQSGGPQGKLCKLCVNAARSDRRTEEHIGLASRRNCNRRQTRGHVMCTYVYVVLYCTVPKITSHVSELHMVAFFNSNCAQRFQFRYFFNRCCKNNLNGFLVHTRAHTFLQSACVASVKRYTVLYAIVPAISLEQGRIRRTLTSTQMFSTRNLMSFGGFPFGSDASNSEAFKKRIK